MEKGKFIVIDGGDGAGKTTVVKRVVEYLGWSALQVREPGGTPYAERVRDLILSDDAKSTDAVTQFLMFWAARRDLVRQVIEPRIKEGKIIISDRFDSTTYAYQIHSQGKELEDLFWEIRKRVLGDFEPDLYIYLKVRPETGMERTRKRGEELNHFDRQKLDFHRKTAEGLEIFIGEKIKNGHIIDAQQPLDVVVKDTLRVIEEMLY